MNRKFFIVTGIVFSLILFLLMTAYFFGQATRNISLPIYGAVNDFYLTDVNGKELGLPDLRNKIWVANFFFTTCSDICPMMTKNMAALHRSYKLMDDVPAGEKQRRAEEIMHLQQEISQEINQKKVGHTFKVLFDRKEGDYFVGRTEADSPEVDNEVLVDAKNTYLRIGHFADVRITKATEFDLYGELSPA